MQALDLPIVVDHMERTDASAGIATAGFQSLLPCSARRLRGKRSGAHRISRNAPDYPDARPFQALVAEDPDQLIWGGDWPHPRMDGEMPDVGRLLDRFQEWASDAAIRRRILVGNPARLYGFN